MLVVLVDKTGTLAPTVVLLEVVVVLQALAVLVALVLVQGQLPVLLELSAPAVLEVMLQGNIVPAPVVVEDITEEEEEEDVIRAAAPAAEAVPVIRREPALLIPLAIGTTTGK